MGYYDGNDLPFYYYMASQFATSDRWFSPTPTNSEVNRMYVMAATSQGHAHKPSNTFACCTSDTIFHRLEAAGVSWKIYYTNLNPNTGKPLTDVNSFWSSFADAHSDKIVPVSQYFTDLNNNSLPAVAFIQTGYLSGQDEHPGGYVTPGPPWNAGSNIQYGAQYVAKILTSLMQSPAWISSTFIFAFDEGGGLYDHVPPMFGVPNPDGIPPQDLIAGKDPSGDFTRTGFRVPFMVVSPFAKKHYVSHTAADSTAILAFIEKRFGLQPLTKRDAAQMDMTEFFDFVNVPWAIPPSPPSQPDTLPCDRSMLPSNP
jgi:phospholipase C